MLTLTTGMTGNLFSAETVLNLEASGAPREPEVWQMLLNKAPILEAAAFVLSEKGVPDTTVQDILDRAGISRGTFYKYFRNKQEVLTELYRYAASMLTTAIGNAAQQASEPLVKVRAGVDVFLAVHEQWGDLMRVLQPEAMRSDSPLYPIRQAAHAKLVALMDAGVWQAQGRRVDLLVYRALILALESISNHILTQTAGNSADFTRARQAMLSIIENVLAPPGSPVTPLPMRSAEDEEATNSLRISHDRA